LKNTPKSSTDYPVLQQTLDKLQKIAEEVNEFAKKKDNADKLFDLSQRFVDFEENINTPDRICLFERELPLKIGAANKESYWVQPLKPTCRSSRV